MSHRLRRIPPAGWLCALVGLATSLAWGFITPPIHVPDENAHFAYVQYFAETGRLPRNLPDGEISTEENRILSALDFYVVVGRPDSKPAWTRAADDRLRRAEADHGSRVGDGSALTAANNPPLYHLIQAVPYRFSPSSDLLDRLALMRIVSAFMAATTVLLIFAFVRESIPGESWAWTVGGLAVALQPLFGFLGGGVNNDNLLYLTSAGLFLAIARIFRRGLNRSTGMWLGSVTAAGLLSKASFVAFLPAVVLGVAVLLWRARGTETSHAARIGAGAFGLTAILPVAAYVVALRTVWTRPVVDAVGSLSSTPGGRAYDIVEQLSYAWQLYLPRLPFMTPQFSGDLPLHDLWFTGLVGRFGWLDFGFPAWVHVLAWGFAAVVIASLAVGTVRFRRQLGARRAELAVYAVAALGLLAVIAFVGYRARVDTGQRFEQARYLLPLLPLYGAGIAVAVRSLGARVGQPVGVLLVSAACAHTLFSQLLTLGRFYG